MTDYEVAFIACLLGKPSTKNDVADFKPEYFSDPLLGDIFKAVDADKSFPQISKELASKIPFNNLLEWSDKFKIITGDLAQYYGELVLEEYKQRKAAELPKDDFDAFTAKVNELQAITVFEKRPEKVSDEFLKGLEEIMRRGEDMDTIKTGFDALDQKIRGFMNSEMIIIGARPSMGKSTLGMNIAYNMAREGKKIAYFSLEMSQKDLHKRLVKMQTGIENLYRIDMKQFESCARASRDIEDNLPIAIYDKPDMTVEGIRGICNHLREKDEIDAVFIDHMSILKSNKSFRSRYEEASDISRQLKVIAKEINRPVVALCQLNRGVENKEVKFPTMADLRDSGKIEEDADMICFIHREEYYYIQRNEECPADKKGMANLSIAKNRRGGVGMVTLGFNPRIPTFY